MNNKVSKTKKSQKMSKQTAKEVAKISRQLLIQFLLNGNLDILKKPSYRLAVKNLLDDNEFIINCESYEDAVLKYMAFEGIHDGKILIDLEVRDDKLLKDWTNFQLQGIIDSYKTLCNMKK
ncbi:hypothetical protein [Carboxylicivirga sp. RSCT41]|uniref:hypothetical protein n=1 Tax=Carboxylicivirga agarovorans TaxID=3417570 RepID=UPI003D35986A